MSWEQLGDIAREAAQIQREEQTRPRVACPRCGEPLISVPGTELSSCRFDGWRSDQDT